MTSNVYPFGKGISYGGERIIGYLSEGLADLGHEVHLFARQGTIPPSNVKAFVPVEQMRPDRDVYYDSVHDYLLTTGVKPDVYNCAYFGEAWNKQVLDIAPVYVETVWNRWAHLPWQYKETGFNIVSYSKVLQSHFRQVGVETTMIHYGLPKDLYTFSDEFDNYVVWIGKIEGGKAPSLAIKIALAAGMKIVIMGPPYNTGTFWQEVAPYIDNKNVFWVRGVDDDMKGKIMSRAKCFISSNRDGWVEHAGIVNIESLACGTPILAFNRTTDPSAIWTDQIIRDSVEGFFLNYETSEDETFIIEKGVSLLNRIGSIDRKACRKRFEDMFTNTLAARRYTYLYAYIQTHGNVQSIEFPF